MKPVEFPGTNCVYGKNHETICKAADVLIVLKSVGEDAISEWLEYNKIEYKSQHWIEPNQVLFGARRLRVDFYLPSIKTIIEFNGRQHYERVAAWQTEEEFQEQKDRDRRLREFCKQKGIMLIEIPYTEIKNINAILRSRVTATLG